MGVKYISAFHTGNTPMAVVVSGIASGTATLSTGLFVPGSYNPGFQTYRLAVELQTKLQAIHAGFTVTFSTSGLDYEIDNASGNFDLTWTGTAGTNLMRALGFTANLTGTSNYASTVRPYYLINASESGRSNFSHNYEPDDIVKESVSDGGTSYGVSKDTTETWCDWQQSMELGTATTDALATAAVPWTWEKFFKHQRAEYQFAIIDGANGYYHQLRAQGASFSQSTRQPVAADYTGLFNINLMTRYLGSWTP